MSNELTKSLCTCTCHNEEHQCDQCCPWSIPEVEKAFKEKLDAMAWGKLTAQAKAEAYEDAARYLESRAAIIRGDWNGPDILNQSAHEIRARAKEVK